MRKISAYRGVVKEDPKQMQTKSLESYLRWCNEYLEWCLDADGRVNAYDRMSARMEPYFEELEKRKGEVK